MGDRRSARVPHGAAAALPLCASKLYVVFVLSVTSGYVAFIDIARYLQCHVLHVLSHVICSQITCYIGITIPLSVRDVISIIANALFRRFIVRYLLDPGDKCNIALRHSDNKARQ